MSGTTNCLLGVPTERDDESSKLTLVEYWYGVESSADYNRLSAWKLESEISQVAKSSLSWCYQLGTRQLQSQTTEDYFVDEHGRRLAIMAMSSGPVDQPYTGEKIDSCPQELTNPGDQCFIMVGGVSLTSKASNDLSMSINDIRAGIKYAMDSDALLDPNDELLSSITKVVYLGDSEDDVIAFGIVPGGDKGVDAGTSRSDIFVPILAASLVGTGLIALLLLLMRRRRQTMTQRQLDYAAAVAAASDDQSAASSMDDPTGSFHQGYYHYTKDGVRYLSQFCSTCRETERQLAMGHGLETISEDEQYIEGRNRLVQADSKNLGKHFSTCDVHNCASAMCTCRDPKADVTFIPWTKERVKSDITTSDATAVISNTQSSRSLNSEKSAEV
jgi:hypothetical protein